jgi:hypothetical protein
MAADDVPHRRVAASAFTAGMASAVGSSPVLSANEIVAFEGCARPV